jgi:hypothetical protein
MIAAYAIGYPLTASFLATNKHLKFAEGPDDLGVIVSFNTQSPNVMPGGNIIMTDSVGMVINPVNWKRDETPAPASESLGVYHSWDFPFYYFNIRENAERRANAFLGK